MDDLDDPAPPSLDRAARQRIAAGRDLFDAVTRYLDAGGGASGARLRAAADEVRDLVGPGGAKALDDGDVLGCALEVLRNARRRRRR